MKPAFIITIMLSLVVYLAPGSQPKQRPANVPAEGQSNHPASPTPTVKTEQAKGDNQSGHGNAPQWYKSPEWVLVIVGVITAFVIGWQSWETRRSATAAAKSVAVIQNQTAILERQAKTSEDAVKATKTSTDALIASQRAWIDGRFVSETPGDYELIARNHGPTPAQLLTCEVTIHREGEEFRWENWESKVTWNRGVLIGGGKRTKSLHTFIPNSIAEEIGKRYVVAVTITYLDVLTPGIGHQTRCAYYYNRSTAHLERLSQYNEYT